MKLSPREKEIVDLVLDGYAYRNIATILGLTRSTVATHMQRVHKKLGTHSHMELVKKMTEAAKPKRPCRVCGGTGIYNPAGFSRFSCMDCGKHHGFYRVHNIVWNTVTQGGECMGHLCLRCLSKRLGRSLCIEDFVPDVPINDTILVAFEMGSVSVLMSYGKK